MKVLSDATAARLLALLDAPAGGRRGIESLVGRRGGRAAPSTAPARMWQIHVSPESGDVTVDAGHAYLSGQLYEIEASAPGTANADDYVILAETADGGLEVSLAAELPDDGSAFAVIGQIREGAAGFFSQQFAGGPVYLSGAAHWGEAWPLKALHGNVEGEWKAEEGGTGVAFAFMCDQEDGGEGEAPARWWRTATFDSRGNLVAVSDRHGDPRARAGEPPPPAGYTCGNPLNGGAPSASGGTAGANWWDDDRNPLDEDDADGVENPLDHEGDGGYTPKCPNPGAES